MTTITLALPDWISREIDGSRIYADDYARMTLAVDLARRNVAHATGGPFGAAVFDALGRLIAVGVNRVIQYNCSVAHAEIMAYMLAQQRVQRIRLNENGDRYILATSAQPCCQCYGATFWAGVDELLIGARSADVEELTAFREGPLPADWIGELERRGITVKRDILREEACDVLRSYLPAGGAYY
jgi:tRNA(Arg) A34 adenosine deaminase TadA